MFELDITFGPFSLRCAIDTPAPAGHDTDLASQIELAPIEDDTEYEDQRIGFRLRP